MSETTTVPPIETVSEPNPFIVLLRSLLLLVRLSDTISFNNRKSIPQF